MEVIHTVAWMSQVARQARSEGRIAGLVATMGALHAGHFSLVQAARRASDPVIVSVFVNPKQFAPGEDYARYPRTLDADREALEKLGVDILFSPSPEEMYPPGFTTFVSVEGLGDRLEGRVRPGHFRGVATVVLKLLEIAVPRFAYFGRKDAQQAQVIRRMARDLSLDPEIVVCPIVREPDGLAMSSRNAYLSAEQRALAPALHRALRAGEEALRHGIDQADEIEKLMHKMVSEAPSIRIDYLVVIDPLTFRRPADFHRDVLLAGAVHIGKTRLIDNIRVSKSAIPHAHVSS
jgi:pantoate--beta-alanine ligase